MAFIPLAIMAVSAVVGAVGAIQQGKTQAANAKSQSEAQRYNAEVNMQNANASNMLASSREQQQRAGANQQLGNIRAAMAEGGGFGGTNEGVLRQDTVNAELDALNTRYSGVLQSRSYTAEAGQDYFQSKVAAANVGAYRSAGYLGAASSLLSGASRMYGSNSAGYG